MTAKVRNALTLYRPLLESEHSRFGFIEATLYNSIYRADDQLFVNQHAYGVPAARSPVFLLPRVEGGDMTTSLPRQLSTYLG